MNVPNANTMSSIVIIKKPNDINHDWECIIFGYSYKNWKSVANVPNEEVRKSFLIHNWSKKFSKVRTEAFLKKDGSKKNSHTEYKIAGKWRWYFSLEKKKKTMED